MGIPSFYRQLCRRYPRIISNGFGAKPEWFCLDFNCAMYHVLRTMPPVATASSQTAWEADFCCAISSYLREICTIVAPTKGIYVSCDGVVCAAKRRQQRLRRFKGPWISAAEARVRIGAGGKPTESSGWDQNALTPGSAFMRTLGSHLTGYGPSLQKSLGCEVIMSTTAEPGEGEHKLLRHMRSVKPTTCTIYGLDADLILLAMLMTVDTGASVKLLREEQEFERTAAEGGWKTLDIGQLMTALLSGHNEGRTRDFVAAMSLLGNDFLPRPLTRTVRNDGIPTLIATLEREVWAYGLCIVGPDGALQRTGLLALIKAWAATEESDVRNAALDAQKAASRPPGIADSPEETALKTWNAAPARWASLTRILGAGGHLRPDWREIYRAWGCGSPKDYCSGVAWVWDYYSGKTVDQGWVYDAHLPPLWSDIATWLTTAKPTISPPLIQYPKPLPEWLHLLSVLPAASVERLLTSHMGLIEKAPWYWPTSWSLFDVGRTQIWECEPVIPVIPEALLRSWALT